MPKPLYNSKQLKFHYCDKCKRLLLNRYQVCVCVKYSK